MGCSLAGLERLEFLGRLKPELIEFVGGLFFIILVLTGRAR